MNLHRVYYRSIEKENKYGVCSTICSNGVNGCVSVTYEDVLMHAQVFDLQEVVE